jgi:hypothetical protein
MFGGALASSTGAGSAAESTAEVRERINNFMASVVARRTTLCGVAERGDYISTRQAV